MIPESSLTSFLKIATRLKCSGLNSDIKSIKEDPKIMEKVEDENELFERLPRPQKDEDRNGRR